MKITLLSSGWGHKIEAVVDLLLSESKRNRKIIKERLHGLSLKQSQDISLIRINTMEAEQIYAYIKKLEEEGK